MSEARALPERIAAARQLYAVLKECLDRQTWTPAEGALIVSGLRPPSGCKELPRTASGLDDRPYAGDVVDRMIKAGDIMRIWEWHCEGYAEKGSIAPTRLEPCDFIQWCVDSDIETEWMRLIFDVISGGKAQPDAPDMIPLSVLEYVARAADALNAIHALAGQVSSDSPGSALAPKKVEKSAPCAPMPVPTNREHVSTDELAAILAVEPQSILKRHSKDGSYLGIRPTKLPNRRLLWPVADVKKLLSGGLS